MLTIVSTLAWQIDNIDNPSIYFHL